jgi:uncharacterized OB-fold protein
MSQDDATPLRPQTAGIPLPEPTHVSQPFWAGANEGELRYQWCDACAIAQMDPRPACRNCLVGPLEWRTSAGLGVISSFTIVWRPPVPSFTVPYAPAIVRLDEGFELLTNIVGCFAADVRIDLAVQAAFHEVEPGRSLPYFRPSPSSDL